MSYEYGASPVYPPQYSSPLIRDSGSPNYHYHRPRSGIYGWRKRCLYFTMLCLGIFSLLNLALTAWIMRHLRFSWRGFGNIKIMPDHLTFNGNTIFNKPVNIEKIQAPKNGNLNLISDRSVIMQAKNDAGNVSNFLYIGPNGLISQGPKFEVRNKNGHTIFSVTPDNMTIKTHTLTINGRNGGRFKGYVQTPLIRSPPSESLRIESLSRVLDIESNGINLKALAGNINVLSLQDIVLNSQEGRLVLQGSKIYFPGLTTPNLFNLEGGVRLGVGNQQAPFSFNAYEQQQQQLLLSNNSPDDSVLYKGIFQLCVCENGRLFLSLPTINCQGTQPICNIDGEA